MYIPKMDYDFSDLRCREKSGIDIERAKQALGSLGSGIILSKLIRINQVAFIWLLFTLVQET